MSLKTAVCALVLVSSAATASRAADATATQADAIKGALERYLGHGPVAVTPAGDAYRIDLDIKKALVALEPFGLKLNPATFTMTATPQGDGTWHVVSGAVPLITAHFGEQTTSVVANKYHFDGSFDPRIPAFTQATSGYDSLSIGGAAKNGATQTRQLGHGQQTLTTTPKTDGVLDLKTAQTIADYAQDIAFDAGKQNVSINIKGGPTTEASAIEGFHIRALADLWAFLVAHPSRAAIAHESDAFKTLLRQAAPVFTHLAQDGSVEHISVTTPFGPASAQSLVGHVDLNGLVHDGRARLQFKIADLVVPTAALPAWAPALLPTAVEFDDAVSGFNAEAGTAAAIDGLDLNAQDLLSAGALDKIKTAVGPLDQMALTIGASRITTPTLDVHYEGQVHWTEPAPAFTATVHATGVDKAIDAVRKASAKDPSAAQVLNVLMLIKGYGKTESDGSFTWVLAGDGTGAITVNDVPLPLSQGK